MDRFEQLTAYFELASEFHKNRDTSICNVMSLMVSMPKLLDNVTQPTLHRKLQHLIASNQGLLPSAARHTNPSEPKIVS